MTQSRLDENETQFGLGEIETHFGLKLNFAYNIYIINKCELSERCCKIESNFQFFN